jgi:oligoendopeptidase F
MRTTTDQTIARPARKFVSEQLAINSWGDLENYYSQLLQRELNSVADLKQLLADRSELDKIVEEDYRWRYVHQTCDTENKAFTEAYEKFLNEILPHLMNVGNDLNKKIAGSAYFDELETDRFFVYKRNLKSALELFRAENIPLKQQEQLRAQEYGQAIGAMTIEHNGEEYTMPQAGKFLQHPDRELRQTIFQKINARRLQDKDKLNALFDDLLKIRQQIAINAGFSNYRDYKLAELGRFDYGVAECEQFHESIHATVVPLLNDMHADRQKKLGLDVLKPYDTEVDPSGKPALNPYQTEEEFTERSIACLDTVDRFFADCISIMHNMKYLDLSSRKGKAPGGYNMEMPEMGVPFIFMNGAGTQRDVETMVHEAGHAVHSFLIRDLEYNFDQDITSEIAELASMSMELLTHEGLKEFYSEEDRQRAIVTHLQGIISSLCWIALIDKFQHWIYTHPSHTAEEREKTWIEFYTDFSSSVADWSDYENFRSAMWQKQLHLFEVPFYYIEYGIAQLGALGVFRNFKRDAAKAVQDYKAALKLGYTRPLPELYKTAGVPFDFSRAHVQELMDFVKSEMPK